MSALLVGYARCSTDQQDLIAQRDALLGLGMPKLSRLMTAGSADSCSATLSGGVAPWCHCLRPRSGVRILLSTTA